MKKILMTRLSVCSLGVSCNEMIDTPMSLVVGWDRVKALGYRPGGHAFETGQRYICYALLVKQHK